ncbi:MAG: thiamine pyrophosphate-dependent enzyme, partial [Patescibacteria group bacterium]|nr:thiamine pyrophosphate-dependent enzyme [Patescibacteria group bacterium]
AGIPALVNVVHNESNPLIIVMDNKTAAMTGHQPYPGIEKTGRGSKGPKVKIEEVIKACGVKNVKIINQAQDYSDFVKSVKAFLKEEKLTVIIARSPCLRIKK